jgi:hypothetical protein
MTGIRLRTYLLVESSKSNCAVIQEFACTQNVVASVDHEPSKALSHWYYASSATYPTHPNLSTDIAVDGFTFSKLPTRLPIGRPARGKDHSGM